MPLSVIKTHFRTGLAFLLFSVAMSQTGFAQAALTAEQVMAERSAAQSALANGDRVEALRRIEIVVRAIPDDLSARFFRAQLLVAMGRGAEIRDEIELMTMLNLPTAERQKARKLLAKIDSEGKRLSGKITLKAAVGYADNVNAWPSGGTVTRGGLKYPLPDPVYRKFNPVSDRINEGQVSIIGAYDLNEARNTKTEFSLFNKVKHAPDTVSADQRYYLGSVGLKRIFNKGFVAKGGLSKGRLNRVNQSKGEDVNTDLDLTNYNVEFSRKIDQKVTLGYRFNLGKANHSRLASADLSDSKTKTNRIYIGTPLANSVYVRSSLSTARSTSNLKNGTIAEHTKSRERVNKKTNSLSVLAFFLLPHEQRLIGTATISRVKYKHQMVNTNQRRNDNVRSVTLGYSINGVQVWSGLDGLSLGLDASYSRSGSNQASAKINSGSYMFSVSKSFNM